MLIVYLYFQMLEEDNFNEHVDNNLRKKFKPSEGNYTLSAEILEQVNSSPEMDSVQ